MGKKQNRISRTEDRTQNLLGTSSMDPHHCEREIITIRPCDFERMRFKDSSVINVYNPRKFYVVFQALKLRLR